jgi:hypothetical protein
MYFFLVKDQSSWNESEGDKLFCRWILEAENCVNYCEAKLGLEQNTEFFHVYAGF